MENSRPWGMPMNTYCMLLHLSQLAGWLFPGVGLVLPIVMWAANKDEYPTIDRHGRMVLDWIISLFAYSLVCFVLSFVGIGFIGLWALGIVNVIFAILGAIKAYEGKLWIYPATLSILRRA